MQQFDGYTTLPEDQGHCMIEICPGSSRETEGS